MFSSQIYCVTFVNHRCTGGFTYFTLHFIHATFCIEPRKEKNIFLYTTITGNLQLIHLEQIGYFRYNSKSKLWEAVLNNNHILALKRNTNSQKILSLHPYLIQINQSYIINIGYLTSIEDNNCILLPPFNEMELLQVSKSFMKKLKEKYPCI